MNDADASPAAPRVSVVIIFYNSERFFVEAIESVLAQEYRNFELLLVDDGSSDGSTAIALDYARKFPDRVRYLEHPGHENRGMSATRNLGASGSRGELLAMLDSDDVWMPNKLREQVAILDRYPKVDMVCGTARYWRSWDGGEDRLVPSGHERGRPIPAPEALLSVYPLARAHAPCPSDLLVRRSAWDAVGGFEASFSGRLQLYEDQAFLTKIYLGHAVYFAVACWLNYRIHDAQCIAQASDKANYDEVRSHFLDWFEGYLKRSERRNDPRIRFALARAALRYRHPNLAAAVRSRRTLAKKLGFGRG
jgi:glycosyltransferase involved in cell wall biosynthesis